MDQRRRDLPVAQDLGRLVQREALADRAQIDLHTGGRRASGERVALGIDAHRELPAAIVVTILVALDLIELQPSHPNAPNSMAVSIMPDSPWHSRA